jgi:L-asparaginase II
MLAKIGLDEDALRCGVAPPPDPHEAARITLGLKAQSPLQCECSGEHAGMLAACLHLHYPLQSYTAPDHPLQRRIREIVVPVLRPPEDDLVISTNGCRIPTFAAPVRMFAVAYATLADPKQAPTRAGRELAKQLDRLREAMTALYEVAPNFSEDELTSITVPVLILDGAEEELVAPNQPVRMAELIPGAQLVLMPGTGHFAPLLQPEEFTRIVLAFLAGEVIATPTA